MMIATAIVPRIRDYAVFLSCHFVSCIVAMAVRAGDSTGLMTNFCFIAVVSIAVAYKSERQRREALLLAWWLRRSNIAVALAGPCSAPRALSSPRAYQSIFKRTWSRYMFWAAAFSSARRQCENI